MAAFTLDIYPIEYPHFTTVNLLWPSAPLRQQKLDSFLRASILTSNYSPSVTAFNMS